jgi:2,4-dienoyl-CoA reductase-like NADH-dependent reductase (Old Yellow Enzyme family)/thioredoxin reductase
LKNLFTPIDIGGMRLKNRIVMPAMHLNYTPDGQVNDRLMGFYEERARGGAALIIIGGCIIDEYSGPRMMINLDHDNFIPGLKRLTDKLHAHDVHIAGQLYHAGAYAHSFLIGRQAIAPSAVPSKFTKEVPREMTQDDIRYTIESYAKAARRVKESGFDAVEILSCSGYIINQFLSPITNHRLDEYGGSLEKRMRFGLEVAEAVRDAVGNDFPVLIRLSGHDFVPGSSTNKEICSFAAELEKHGINAFSITGGWHETKVPQLTMEVPRAVFSYLAQGIKHSTSKPVIASNRIHSPAVADRLIRQGSIDLVGFARELIADPEMPKKAMEGRLDEIVPCIGCNQGCFDHVFELKPVECMVNPRVSHESDIPAILRTTRPKKIMVIGGGPAGLSTAITAARAGHEVALYEKTHELGGQLKIAGGLEDRREFETLRASLIVRAQKAGVKIHTNTEVTRRHIEKEQSEIIIMATGGKPLKPAIPGIDGRNVVQAWDVLAERVDTGDEIVVIGGGAVGIEAATKLAKIGTLSAEALQFLFLASAEDSITLRELSTRGIKKVTIIEMLPRIGMDIGLSTRWVALQMLARYGVNIRTETKVVEITADGVIAEHDENTDLIKCDQVVLAVGTQPQDQLMKELSDHAAQVIVIGDAKSPRKAYEAIHEGFYSVHNLD